MRTMKQMVLPGAFMDINVEERDGGETTGCRHMHRNRLTYP